MAGSIYSWSTTAADNGTADGDVPWPEGMARRQVNDSARSLMGRVAEYRSDLGGALSAGGTANGLTVTANSAFTAYADGLIISFRATADNTAAATLNVNGIGAKAIRKMDTTGDVALGAGDIQDTGIYIAQYSAALNGAAGAWLLVNPTLAPSLVGGAASSTDNAIVRWNGTTGRVIQNSSVVIDDSNNVTGVVALTASGAVASGGFSVSGTGATQYTSTRTGSATNVSMQFATTSGSVYVGQGAANTFAIKDDNALATAPWFSVSSTAATIAGTLKVGAGADTTAVSGAILAMTNNGTTAASLRNSTSNVESYWACDANDSYIGTLGAHDFSIFTNDTNRLTFDGTTGAATFTESVTADSFSGVGTSLTALNATNLSSGTVASARVAGSYTGITGTGALNAGSITSGFGSIDVGADAISGGAISGTTGAFSGVISVPAGSAAAPAISFGGAPDTGYYRSATDELGIAIAGAFLGNITVSGINLGKAAQNAATVGASLGADGQCIATVASDTVWIVNRTSTEGTIIQIRADNVTEGTISEAGGTVSYNALLASHWSQLLDGSKPNILKGTICETIDELCEWSGETNDRLPKFKISDTQASPSVYGVFLAWDNDDDHNDAYVAAVGAGWIRVADGEAVQRGALIESNGDGCGRVQADSVMRSSTVGKITSAAPVATYSDGSKLYTATLHCG